MFLLSPHTKVFLAQQITDMRKSFRGLLTLTEEGIDLRSARQRLRYRQPARQAS